MTTSLPSREVLLAILAKTASSILARLDRASPEERDAYVARQAVMKQVLRRMTSGEKRAALLRLLAKARRPVDQEGE